MSKKSTFFGKAYEYACILALQKTVEPIRKIVIEQNESYTIAKERYEKEITDTNKDEMLLSAKSGIEAIIEMEPRILEDGNDLLTISLQPDNVATEQGDIRDVIMIRRSIEWEIGISVKHNHAALKHSRLSSRLDFGEKWMNAPCSQDYFNEIKPIFEKLEEWKTEKLNWSDLANKDQDVYVPLLSAFMTEFIRLHRTHNITSKLMKYLLGSNGKDYYKLIHNKNHTTTVMPFNIFGTLNQPSEEKNPSIVIPKIEVPNRIIEMAFKEDSMTTIILTMNNGWSISFRIHNASTKVEGSLKFDITLQSKPEDIFYLNCEW